MLVGSIARRYAKALFDLAAEAGRVEAWARSLAEVKQAVEGSPELRTLLASPVHTKEQRQAVAARLASGLGLEREPASLLALLAERNRLAQLPAVADTFGRLADEKVGRVRARVTSAAALDEPTAGALAERLAAASKAQVVVERAVDPALLGGVVAQVGSLVYDGSLRAQLEDLRRALKR
ncbi:MAG TPA: F0F1 ATP synthase subunit delta [Anaeromyxobacteraceae bacterium]|jgi:F-type H+-transporting ATPase subunit delta